jgi:phosphate starvation-inducible PhoH-like protein
MNYFPKTHGQCKYMLALRSNKPIVVGTGPAGSGKTMLACQVALEHVTRGKRLVLTRPVVPVGEDLGYLPGDLDAKMEPWARSMYDILEKRLTYKQICIEPLGYMRGRTFENTVILADEMQNATSSQMRMLLTRVGEGTRLLITGDLEQSDLGEENGLRHLIQNLSVHHTDHIQHVHMTETDIVRHPAVHEALKILQK